MVVADSAEPQSTDSTDNKTGSNKASRFIPRALVGTFRTETGYDHGDAVPVAKPNWVVFGFSSAIILAIALYTFLATESAEDNLNAITSWIASNFGWFYILTATAVVIFVLVVAFSRTGNIRLGPDHSRPKYSLYTWASMLFAAGIGVDLMFFGVAEPLTQYFEPPTTDPETYAAAKEAVAWAMFHYGIVGWAMYALMGMAFGYFAYRLNMPLAIRSALYPIIGKRIHGAAGHTVEIAAMLGTVFGIAASLGIGVVQLSYGLHIIFDVELSMGLQATLVAVGVIVATISAISGVDKGIRRLSELNVAVAIFLGLYVLIAGKTAWLLNALIDNVGTMLASFPSWVMDTYAYADDQEAVGAWMEAWTLFFWAWWIAWATFVGLFLARISRGRTLRQFVIGTLMFPFLFIVLWMSFFGNSALDLVMGGNNEEFAETAMAQPESGFYELLGTYPGASALILLATLCGLLLYITSADSGALVMANFTSHIVDHRQDGAPWLRVFWSLTVGVLTLGMLGIGGVAAVQAATVIMGLPFAFVMWMVMFSLWKSLRQENIQRDSRAVALHSAIAGRVGGARWKSRIGRANRWPSGKEITEYFENTATPALEKLCTELRSEGLDARLLTSLVEECQLPQLDLEIQLGDEREFRYQLYPIQTESPDFVDGSSDYYRLEVFDNNGSMGFDVYGYDEDQLINNVLDLYDRHLEYLHMQAPLRGSSDLSDNSNPVRSWKEDFSE
ncbi:choline BCCT transporter BetT [Corynebacterium propinquum]